MAIKREKIQPQGLHIAMRAGFSFDGVVLPESREFHLGRMRFHYLDWGNRHLPTIVLLHGGALNAHTWDLVCLALRLNLLTLDCHCVPFPIMRAPIIRRERDLE